MIVFASLALSQITATAQSASSAADSFGPNPRIPQPQETLLPTINWARAEGWPAGALPQAGKGLAVKAFARNLKHPRWIYVLPNGDVLVAEAASEPGRRGLRVPLPRTW